MTVSEIVQRLQSVSDGAELAYHEEALRAAAREREAIVPELIAAVDRASADPRHHLVESHQCLHHFAICLLAQFRERRALESFIRFFSLPGEMALDLTGDLVTEQGAAVLASVCGGDPAPLLRLVHDESVNEYVRTQAIDALAVQALWGERSRDEVIDELRRMFRTLQRPGNPFVWAGLIGTVCDFQALELAAEADEAFAAGLVDESIIDQGWLRRSLHERPGEDLEIFRRRNQPVDAVAAISGWCCFRKDSGGPGSSGATVVATGSESPKRDDLSANAAAPSREGEPDPPANVDGQKLCPCGSGKNSTLCCG